MQDQRQSVFISDLHLSEQYPAIYNSLQQFVQSQIQNPHLDAVYILGDLFDTWIGDDHSSYFINQIYCLLRLFTKNHIKLYIMQGNRDFLLGKAFADNCQAVLLSDPTIIDLYGITTVLTHGDILCTQDIAYQRFRRCVRNPFIQKFFLSLPLYGRQYIAKILRQKSQAYFLKTQHPFPQKGIDLKTAEKVIQNHQAQQLIHGHTHQPMIESHDSYTRCVLPDWHPNGGMLRAMPNKTPELIEF